jgi:spermidine/putrescine transport system substrate-binding protein
LGDFAIVDNEIRYQRLRAQYGNRDITRKNFLGQIGTMALACGVMLSGTTALSRYARAARSVRFDGYGGFSQAAFNRLVLEPFTQKTGISVTQGSYGSTDQMITAARADGLDAYNFFWSSDEITPVRLAQLHWGVELDESKIPRLGDLIPRSLEEHRKLGGGKLGTVPYCLSGGWLAYNTEKITAEEMDRLGYDILADERFRGATTGQNYWQQRIWFSALQTKQDPNNIKDMNAIWDCIRDSRARAVKFWGTSAEQIQLFTSGNAVVGDAWFVPIYNLHKQGKPIAGWPSKGSYCSLGSIVTFKGSPLDALYEMVDILLRPEVSIPLAIQVGNLPLLDPNKFAFPPEVKAIPGYDPTGTLAGYTPVDPFYYSANSEVWSREYQHVVARG